MRKNLLRALVVLAALFLTMGCALAEDNAEAPVIALVNGEELLESEYASMESYYYIMYGNSGADLTDETIKAYVQDLALTAAIEDMLVEQDMRVQGCYELDEATEDWCLEQGQAAYEQALKDVGESIRETLETDDDADMSEYALTYAQLLGVTVEDYIDVYRTQIATVNYYAWLTRDCPVTEEEVQAAFDEQNSEETELTQEVYDQLAYTIYSERCQLKLDARIDELAQSAEVTLY